MLKSRDLMGMTSAELDSAILGAMSAAEQEQSTRLAEIDAKVAYYEARFHRATADVKVALRNHEMEETLEICDWLFWADVRDSIATPRS